MLLESKHKSNITAIGAPWRATEKEIADQEGIFVNLTKCKLCVYVLHFFFLRLHLPQHRDTHNDSAEWER